MNLFAILRLVISYRQLNSGQSAYAKQILKEGVDVIQSLGNAMKDKKITRAEKKALVKELREFTKTTINALDDIIIPE